MKIEKKYSIVKGLLDFLPINEFEGGILSVEVFECMQPVFKVLYPELNLDPLRLAEYFTMTPRVINDLKWYNKILTYLKIRKSTNIYRWQDKYFAKMRWKECRKRKINNEV